jgi:Spy/CpxP family protein refolding chaperone
MLLCRAQSSLAALAFAAGLALAQGAGAGAGHKGFHRDKPPGGLVTRHAERLGLDDATRERVDRIVEESRIQHEELETEIRAARRRVFELLSSDVPDKAAVLQQAEALGALETEAHKNRLRAMMQIRALLTPEQRAELMRIREERPWRHRRGRLGRCTGEIQEHCAGGEPGLPALECLRDHWTELSGRCQAAFDPTSTSREGPAGDR